MKKRNLKHNRSGQSYYNHRVMVATLLLFPTFYIFETEKEVPTADASKEMVSHHASKAQ